MTPVEYCEAILKTLQDVAGASGLPDIQVTGVGDAVIACAEARVTFNGVTLQPNLQNTWACEVEEVGTYLVTIARECAWTSNDDGTENYEKLAELVETVDADVTALTALFKAIGFGVESVVDGAVGWGTTRSGTINVVNTGAVVISTLTLTVGVP